MTAERWTTSQSYPPFVQIAAAGSLSAASREMGSLRRKGGEKRGGGEASAGRLYLIARSTRSLALTEEGQRLFERAQRILAEVDEAEATLRRGRAEPEGLLRSAPHALGRAHVSPVCRDLVRAHPKISAELNLTDIFMELIDERMDVVARIGAL